MNSCEKGILADSLLHHHLPHKVLSSCLRNIPPEQKDEMIEYLGSFLKAYHRMFCVDWLHKFIVHGHFELLELCCKFYNCPEELTKTTVLNILLSLLSHKEVRIFISKGRRQSAFYANFAACMCRQFRNELAEYNLRIEHASLEDNVNLVLSEFEDKVSLWEDISHSAPVLFRQSFAEQVLYPLLIGSIRNDKMPLFTLKFSLFALNKLVPALHGLGLLETLVSLLFFDENVVYSPSTLFKAGLPPFSLEKLRQLLEREVEDADKEGGKDGGKNEVKNGSKNGSKNGVKRKKTMKGKEGEWEGVRQ